MALHAQVYRSCILWFVFVLVVAMDKEMKYVKEMKLEQEKSESEDGFGTRPGSARIWISGRRPMSPPSPERAVEGAVAKSSVPPPGAVVKPKGPPPMRPSSLIGGAVLG